MVYMKKTFLTLLLLITFNSNYTAAEELKIADFNRGEKPNLISGDYGAWNITQWDRTQFCNEDFVTDPTIVYGGRGCSLSLYYDVDSPNSPAYNGFWMRLERINLENWNYLSFYIRGDDKTGYTNEIVIEIKSIYGRLAIFNIQGITSEWKKVILPLKEITQKEDFSEAYEFCIIFDERKVTQKVGRIYIDEFYLYK